MMMRNRGSAFSSGLLLLFIIIAAAATIALSVPSAPVRIRHLAAARVLLPEADQQEIGTDDVVYTRIGWKRRSRSPGWGSATVVESVPASNKDEIDSSPVSTTATTSPPPGSFV